MLRPGAQDHLSKVQVDSLFREDGPRPMAYKMLG